MGVKAKRLYSHGETGVSVGVSVNNYVAGESDDSPKRHPAEVRHLSIQCQRRSELSVGLPNGQAR